jgi:hypothetical protein
MKRSEVEASPPTRVDPIRGGCYINIIEKVYDVAEIQGSKCSGHDVIVASSPELKAVGGDLDCTRAVIEPPLCPQPDNWHPLVRDVDTHDQIIELEVYSAAWNART